MEVPALPEIFGNFDVTYVWLALLIVFVVIEAVTASLVTIWFAAGALAALIVSLFGLPEWACLIVFLTVSVASLVLTRPLVRKKLKPSIVATNADTVVGQTAVVEEKIDNTAETGSVLISGNRWMARSADGEVFDQGQQVVVDRIEGVKVICHSSDTVKETVSDKN